MSEPATLTIRKVASVVLDRLDGSQTILEPDLRIYARGRGAPIPLHQVLDVLADPDGWVEYETSTTWEPAEDLEPWQLATAEPVRKARARIYARGVVACLVVYDEDA